MLKRKFCLFFLRFIFLYGCMCISVCLCAPHICRCTRKPEGIRFSGTGVTGSCSHPTWVLGTTRIESLQEQSSSLLSCCCDHPVQNQLREERVYFTFHVAAHNQVKAQQELLVGSWMQKLKQRPWRSAT